MSALMVNAVGAVTSVGLTAFQTCAAIRARISGFRDAAWLSPTDSPVVGAVVPARSWMKCTQHEWLANLALRAINECLYEEDPNPASTAILISLPEIYREHPAFANLSGEQFLNMIEQRLKRNYHPSSALFREGHAASINAISTARDLLTRAEVTHCVIGGVDSLINHIDLSRLSNSGILHNSDNPQGLIPGESAAFILVSLEGVAHKQSPLGQILGVSAANEKDTIFSERYSVGRGLRESLEGAIRDSQIDESQISFIVSDMNGERYRAWESIICHSRFYRTIRERLDVWYPAASVGDVGAASGTLSIIISIVGIGRGYAPGQFAICESSSDEGLRGACVIGPPSHLLAV